VVTECGAWLEIKWPVVQIQVMEEYFSFRPFVCLGDLEVVSTCCWQTVSLQFFTYSVVIISITITTTIITIWATTIATITTTVATTTIITTITTTKFFRTLINWRLYYFWPRDFTDKRMHVRIPYAQKICIVTSE